MKRGEVWAVAAGTRYVGKPRPAVIVQDRIRRLSDQDLVRLNRAIAVFLGLAGS